MMLLCQSLSVQFLLGLPFSTIVKEDRSIYIDLGISLSKDGAQFAFDDKFKGLFIKNLDTFVFVNESGISFNEKEASDPSDSIRMDRGQFALMVEKFDSFYLGITNSRRFRSCIRTLSQDHRALRSQSLPDLPSAS